MDLTKGNYAQLKRHLFIGDYGKPDWFIKMDEKLTDYVKIALLLGSWSETDKQIIEKSFNISFDVFIREIRKYSYGSDPFIIEYTYNDGKGFFIANQDEAWCCFSEQLSQDDFNLFKAFACQMLSYDESIDQKVYTTPANYLNAGTPKYSTLLRKGVAKALILIKIYCNNNINLLAEQIVKKVVDGINSFYGWCYLSDLVSLFAEAAPEIIYSKLNSEVKKGDDSMLFASFGKPISVGWNKFYPYLNYLWAIELLLSNRHYITKGIFLVCDIVELNKNYSLSNTPKDSLRKIICPWHHTDLLNFEEIKNIEQKIVSKYSFGWDLIASELPIFNSSVIYGEINEPWHPSNVDSGNTFSASYCEELYKYNIALCIRNADSVQRLKRLAENEYLLMDNSFVSLLDEKIETLDDQDKRELQIVLVETLYENRIYHGAKWALPEKYLARIDRILEKIEFKIKEYGFSLYFMSSQWSFLFSHPLHKYEEKQDDIDWEEKLRDEEEELIRRMRPFFEDKLDLSLLIDITSFAPNNKMGFVLSRQYPDFEVADVLLNSSKGQKIFQDYVLELTVNRKEGLTYIKKAIEICRKYSMSPEYCVSIAQIIPVHKDTGLQLTEVLTEEEKQIFWNTLNIKPFFKMSKKFSSTVISNLINNGNRTAFFICLSNNLLKYTLNECIRFLQKDLTSNYEIKESNSFYINRIFDEMYSKSKNQRNKWPEIVKLELCYLSVDKLARQSCTIDYMKASPVLYLEIIDRCFVHDRAKTTGKDKPDNALYLFRLYFSLLFCPCEENGDVDYDKLIIWIDEYRKGLEKQCQIKQFGTHLGRLLAHAPKSKNGIGPCAAICKAIDSLNDQNICDSYLIEVENMRGAYWVSAGKEEAKLANEYLSRQFVWNYPNNSSDFSIICNSKFAYGHIHLFKERIVFFLLLIISYISEISSAGLSLCAQSRITPEYVIRKGHSFL